MEKPKLDIGLKIKKCRQNQELTQKELAKMSGVSISTLTKIETNVIVDPSISQIFRLIKALEINFEDLINL